MINVKFKSKKYIALYSIAIIIIFSLFINIFSNSPLLFWQNIFEHISPSKTANSSNVNYNCSDSNEMSVHILDVGKADAIYITSKDKNILIDAGDLEINNKVIEYLKKRGIDNLDFVVTSHPHRDHIGGMPEVIREFKIDRFMMPEVSDEIIPTGKTYESMLMALSERNIKIEKPVIGESFFIGEMKISVLGPVNKYDNLNNNSIVLKIEYGNKSFLFAGDAEKKAEDDIIASGCNLKSDVLKVGHHGSKTSTTQKFLTAVSPKYAIISVGPNKHNLPKVDVIKRIEKNNIHIYRTDINGNIIISTNGNDINVKVEKG